MDIYIAGPIFTTGSNKKSVGPFFFNIQEYNNFFFLYFIFIGLFGFKKKIIIRRKNEKCGPLK